MKDPSQENPRPTNSSPEETVQDGPVAAPAADKEAASLLPMIGLSAGHSVKHWYQQGFWVILPHIKEALALTPVQAGLIITIRQITSAAANFPAGVAADVFPRRSAFILFGSLLSLAVAYILLGLSSSFWLVLVAVSVAGMAPSLWHPPAIAALSIKYPNKRGLAIGLHRTGGSIGDSLSPLVVGVLLTVLAWRSVLFVQVLPAIVFAMIVLWMFRTLGADRRERVPLSTYFQGLSSLITNRTVLSLVVVSGVRGMGHQALFTFLVLYMSDTLDYSDIAVGFHVSLLTLLGMVSAPILGVLSDRVGRRPIIAGSLVYLGVFSLSIVWIGAGWPLAIVVALLGIVLYSVNPVIIAGAMDAIEAQGTEASTAALLFGGSAMFSALSPVIAGGLVQVYGIDSAFYFVGAMMGAGTILALVMPLKGEKRGQASSASI